MLTATPPDVPNPKPMVLATGDVAMSWELDEAYAEIGFDGSGRFYAYAKRPALDPVYIDDEPMSDKSGHTAFPRRLRHILLRQELPLAA